MILTGLPGRDTARTPLPDTSQILDFFEARLEAPCGGETIAPPAHFEIPDGSGEGAAKAARLLTVLGGSEMGARVYAGAISTRRRLIPNWARFIRLRRTFPVFGAP